VVGTNGQGEQAGALSLPAIYFSHLPAAQTAEQVDSLLPTRIDSEIISTIPLWDQRWGLGFAERLL